jgi:hypothetical protein
MSLKNRDELGPKPKADDGDAHFLARRHGVAPVML